MRFLGIGDYCDLAALYLRLAEKGHEVKVSIANPLCQGTLAGMVEHVADWRNALDWIKSAGLEGMLLFENVAHGSGELQDALRADGFNVVGGSAFGDRLENDRAFAQRVLAQAGLAIARHWEFQDAKSACEFLKKNQRRCVLKFNGPEAAIDNYVGRLHGNLHATPLAIGRLRQRTIGKMHKPHARERGLRLLEKITLAIQADERIPAPR